MKKIKKPSIIIALVLLAIIGGIAAYFADGDTKTNRLRIGSNDIKIIEDFNPPEDIEPGTSFKKEVTIKNTGLSNCYARVKVVFTRSDMKDVSIIDWNTSSWKYDESDGYYYYNKPLKKDEISDPLMENVTISEFAEAEKLNSYDIIIYAESIQADTFENYKDAWEEALKNIK